MTTYQVTYKSEHGSKEIKINSEMFEAQCQDDYFWIYAGGVLMAVIPGCNLVSIEKIG